MPFFTKSSHFFEVISVVSSPPVCLAREGICDFVAKDKCMRFIAKRATPRAVSTPPNENEIAVIRDCLLSRKLHNLPLKEYVTVKLELSAMGSQHTLLIRRH